MLFELVFIACKSQNPNSPKAFLHLTLDTCSDSLVTRDFSPASFGPHDALAYIFEPLFALHMTTPSLQGADILHFVTFSLFNVPFLPERRTLRLLPYTNRHPVGGTAGFVGILLGNRPNLA